MMRKRLSLTVLPAGLVALMALAGCGGESAAQHERRSSRRWRDDDRRRQESAAGQILTDSKGDTVYVFAKDTKGKSECSGACAGVWPPVTTSGSRRPVKVSIASKLETTKRSDGSTQVTYAGHPLYTYTAEASPGDTNGNGINEYGARRYGATDGAHAPASGSTSGGSTPAALDHRRRLHHRRSSGGGYGY